MTQIKLRRDTSAAFASSNPILGNGEPAYETDTKKLKIGDGTTAYTQLEYFSAGGGGEGTTDISATLPLKIVDGVISLEVDGQTIQIVDGKLHANLDELGNEVNTLAGDVTVLQADLPNKQDKFETQAPLSISSSSITTSVPAGITETSESWTGGGHDELITVNVSALNIDANSDWKIHLSGYMGDYKSTDTNTNVLLISAEKNTIFRVWFGSWDFRLGNQTAAFKRIPSSNTEFFYEIVHQKNGTEFIFNGTNLVDSSPLPIQAMFEALGLGNYRTLAGQGKLEDFSFLINSYQFQRIDRDISKSYFEANGVKYPFTSVEGTNTLNLNIGDGLSVVDGKLVNTNPTAYTLPTASSSVVGGIKVGDNLSITKDGTLSATGGSSEPPANMVTTDTAQTITGHKTFSDELTINRLDGVYGDYITTHPLKGAIRFGNAERDVIINGKSVTDEAGNKFLTSGDKESIMGYIMPDYSTRTEVPWNTDNTAPTDGYVEVMGEGDGSTSAFVLEYTINGVKTTVSSCYATSRNTKFRLPVICPKGTVYSAKDGAFMHELHFISMKGAV